jgi:hypothetical protein
MNDTILANAYRAVIEDRIHELWTRRRWYAMHLGWIPEQRTEDMAELRYLVSLARKARALAAPPVVKAYDADYWAGDHHIYQAAS